MKLMSIALASVLVLGTAGSAVAAKGGGLTAGGNTIGGPGVVSMDTGVTVTVLDGLDNDDICVTVANTGKEAVRLDLIESAALASQVSVPAGTTVTLCDGLDSVDLLCEGTKSCTAEWRADTF